MKVYEVRFGKVNDQGTTFEVVLRGVAVDAIEATQKAKQAYKGQGSLLSARPLYTLDW